MRLVEDTSQRRSIGAARLAASRVRETGAALAEVGVELIPDVAHRRVHVADVDRAWRRPAAFGHRVAGRDDQLELAQIERLDRERKESSKVASIMGLRIR